MSTKRMKRPAETVPVPQSAEEASALLAEIGERQRNFTVIQVALHEAVAAATARAEADAAPIKAAIERATQGLQVWAEANRVALTDGGTRKTVTLPSGEISWRLRPPSVRVTDEGAVVAKAVELDLVQFIRTTIKLNREALLADPVGAMQLPGVSIGSKGEEFIVTPIAAPLAPAVQS
jgi:phage host-nuclease inhibitor protein Gam